HKPAGDESKADNSVLELNKNLTVFVAPPNKKVAARHEELSKRLSVFKTRVGSLTIERLGQIDWENSSFHNANHIYSVGFRMLKRFWSNCKPFPARCTYRLEIRASSNISSAHSAVPVFSIVSSDAPDQPILSSNLSGNLFCFCFLVLIYF